MNKDSKIYIAGHRGMVGSSCWRILNKNGYHNLIGASSNELDLRDFNAVYNFLKHNKPEIIINAAAKVGGILANDKFPYEFIADNMQIQNNLIINSHKIDVSKFIFLGSSCIYPKFSKQPIKEEYLLTDSLEPTNQWYAVAKISGVKLIESLRKQYNRDYVSLMPTNLYGINDNFNLNSSHVIPALLRKFHDAKENDLSFVELWGSGNSLREFLYVDDLASAILHILENKFHHSIYNVGSGSEISISALASIVKKIVGFKGEIKWDKSKPDGTPRKLIDSKRLRDLGWRHNVDLEIGLNKTYNWFLENSDSFRK